MKNRERKWIKYREDQHCKAFNREWNRFVTMLRYKKCDLIHNLVNINNTDSKKLYKTVTELAGQNKQNPIPESISDQQLGEDFAASFFNKIQNIRKLFKGTHTYTPRPNDTPHLDRFSTLTDEKIYKTTLRMPSKSGELDTITTTFLIKVLTQCLPSIAKIVNLSLGTGGFCEGWKSAVVWPLIKAYNKGTLKTNYRPVSNLPFISIIIEKCTLNQLIKHCDMQNLVPDTTQLTENSIAVKQASSN